MKQVILILLLFTFSSAIIAQPITDSLAAYYPLNNGSGFDATGNGNNGVIFDAGPVEDCAGNQNSAVDLAQFSTSSGYILLLYDINNLFREDTAFTVSFWIKKDSIFQANDATLLHKDEAQAPPLFNSQSIGITVDNIVTFGQCSQANPTLIADNWHHILVTYDHGSRNLYVDHNLEGSSELDFFEMNNAVLSFGRFYHGVVDELMIFNRVLEADEITELFNQFGTTSITSAVTHKQISVQPNPTSNYIEIKAKGLQEIRLIDLKGQATRIAIYSTGESHKVALDNFKAGLYAVLLMGMDGELLGTKKIIIHD